MDYRSLVVPAWARVDDVHVRTVEELMRPAELLDELPMTRAIRDFVGGVRAQVARVIQGSDARLLVVVGPCSIHDVPATLEYAKWLTSLQTSYGERLLIVMRVYFEKPRTRGGWKGLINDPYLDGSFRINEGLRRARSLLLEINGMGIPTATEFVDPITPQYIGDLVSWAAIGARTTESPVHRELASGLSCPVGFKNSLSGDIGAAVNAVASARRPHHFLGVTKMGRAAIVATVGNPDGHVVLRGGPAPNYGASAVTTAAALLASAGLPPRVMVDCSHGNCQGDYRRQVLVAQDIARQREAGSEHICGVMIESNLLGGCQPLVSACRPVPGLSITDPCLGIEDTAELMSSLAGVETSAFA